MANNKNKKKKNNSYNGKNNKTNNNVNKNNKNSNKNNNSNNKNNNNNKVKTTNKTNTTTNNRIKENTTIMKTLVGFGVILFCLALFYMAYHFFVEESNIKVNMSTDKQLVYIDLAGTETLTTTQKYVSDLNYSMRYDVNSFKVFKYKSQDIFKNLIDERILIMVEKSSLPSTCLPADIETENNNCYVIVDDYTEIYYIYTTSIVYKITVKTPGSDYTDESTFDLIEYMLSSFEITE